MIKVVIGVACVCDGGRGGCTVAKFGQYIGQKKTKTLRFFLRLKNFFFDVHSDLVPVFCSLKAYECTIKLGVGSKG